MACAGMLIYRYGQKFNYLKRASGHGGLLKLQRGIVVAPKRWFTRMLVLAA